MGRGTFRNLLFDTDRVTVATFNEGTPRMLSWRDPISKAKLTEHNLPEIDLNSLRDATHYAELQRAFYATQNIEMILSATVIAALDTPLTEDDQQALKRGWTMKSGDNEGSALFMTKVVEGTFSSRIMFAALDTPEHIEKSAVFCHARCMVAFLSGERLQTVTKISAMIDHMKPVATNLLAIALYIETGEVLMAEYRTIYLHNLARRLRGEETPEGEIREDVDEDRNEAGDGGREVRRLSGPEEVGSRGLGEPESLCKRTGSSVPIGVAVDRPVQTTPEDPLPADTWQKAMQQKTTRNERYRWSHIEDLNDLGTDTNLTIPGTQSRRETPRTSGPVIEWFGHNGYQFAYSPLLPQDLVGHSEDLYKHGPYPIGRYDAHGEVDRFGVQQLMPWVFVMPTEYVLDDHAYSLLSSDTLAKIGKGWSRYIGGSLWPITFAIGRDGVEHDLSYTRTKHRPPKNSSYHLSSPWVFGVSLVHFVCLDALADASIVPETKDILESPDHQSLSWFDVEKKHVNETKIALDDPRSHGGLNLRRMNRSASQGAKKQRNQDFDTLEKHLIKIFDEEVDIMTEFVNNAFPTDSLKKRTYIEQEKVHIIRASKIVLNALVGEAIEARSQSTDTVDNIELELTYLRSRREERLACNASVAIRWMEDCGLSPIESRREGATHVVLRPPIEAFPMWGPLVRSMHDVWSPYNNANNNSLDDFDLTPATLLLLKAITPDWIRREHRFGSESTGLLPWPELNGPSATELHKYLSHVSDDHRSLRSFMVSRTSANQGLAESDPDALFRIGPLPYTSAKLPSTSTSTGPRPVVGYDPRGWEYYFMRLRGVFSIQKHLREMYMFASSNVFMSSLTLTTETYKTLMGDQSCMGDIYTGFSNLELKSARPVSYDTMVCTAETPGFPSRWIRTLMRAGERVSQSPSVEHVITRDSINRVGKFSTGVSSPDFVERRGHFAEYVAGDPFNFLLASDYQNRLRGFWPMGVCADSITEAIPHDFAVSRETKSPNTETTRMIDAAQFLSPVRENREPRIWPVPGAHDHFYPLPRPAWLRVALVQIYMYLTYPGLPPLIFDDSNGNPPAPLKNARSSSKYRPHFHDHLSDIKANIYARFGDNFDTKDLLPQYAASKENTNVPLWVGRRHEQTTNTFVYGGDLHKKWLLYLKTLKHNGTLWDSTHDLTEDKLKVSESTGRTTMDTEKRQMLFKTLLDVVGCVELCEGDVLQSELTQKAIGYVLAEYERMCERLDSTDQNGRPTTSSDTSHNAWESQTDGAYGRTVTTRYPRGWRNPLMQWSSLRRHRFLGQRSIRIFLGKAMYGLDEGDVIGMETATTSDGKMPDYSRRPSPHPTSKLFEESNPSVYPANPKPMPPPHTHRPAPLQTSGQPSLKT